MGDTVQTPTAGQPGVKKRIGDMLVDGGIVTSAMLVEALEAQRERGTKIVETLIQLGHLTVDDFVNFLSRQPGIASIDLKRYHVPRDIIALIPVELARQHEILPVDRMGRLLTLAMACPLDSCTIEAIQEHTGLRVKPILCSAEDIHTAIQSYYPSEELATEDASASEDLTRRETETTTTAKARTGMKLKQASELIRELSSLPTLPSTVTRVQEAVGDLTITPRDVAGIISEDPAIAAKVLSVANSPAYGFSSQIETIELAVALLGLRESYSIVLGAAVLDLYQVTQHFDYRRYWEESMNAAAAARTLMQACGQNREGIAFTSGLLHDIGRIALMETVPDLYVKVPSHLVGDDLVKAEDDIVGLTHTEAGYELASHWNLPDSIKASIRYHHRPQDASDHEELVTVVALAERWTRDQELTPESRSDIIDQSQALLSRLPIDDSSVGAAYDLVAVRERAHFAWDASEAATRTS